MDLESLRNTVSDELRTRNHERHARLLELERRTIAGEPVSVADRRLILDAMDSATNTLALGVSELEEIVTARRILLLCESIRLYSLLNDKRRFSVHYRATSDASQPVEA